MVLFRFVFSDFFQSDNSAIFIKKSEKAPSKTPHKTHID